ncbi:hypothetical protein D7B24_006812 [Verticillium nonalfalfae]|uniref:Aminoglycoside phosphotransferase domain-containing protein n=1 Tax=Verticillium nonalfalfae TaxID=1051616 RepID=A0A3M9YL26_9PEZI|nr:uncharacterized protein D7B24_006812 [Verticillium nonalfalfae]RNJ60741.1 hypothetical protein D7B24_006812 [Verticillium nonalfalfae]
MSAIRPHGPRSLRHMSYTDAIRGAEIYNFYQNCVLEQTTETDTVLAIKVKPLGALDPSEANMMQYTARNGILAPNVRGVYDIVTAKPIARVLVSERVPGAPLADVWLDMNDAEKPNVEDHLRTQLARMRAYKLWAVCRRKGI